MVESFGRSNGLFRTSWGILVSCFVMIFFNTALVICVNARLQGRDMSVGEGLSHAQAHFTFILAIIAVAMQGICVTILYTYAKTGTVLSAFNWGADPGRFCPEIGKKTFSCNFCHPFYTFQVPLLSLIL
jgi:hypothetical protein